MTDYKRLLTTPISNESMQEYLQYFSSNKLKYHHIDELNNFTVDQLFDDSRRAFVLLFIENNSQNVGHWTVLFRRTENQLEHFDSLGSKRENYIGGIYEKVADFCAKEKCSLLFNIDRCQDNESFVCARWCVLRVMTQHFNNEEFFDFLKRNLGIKTFNSAAAKKCDKFIVDIIRFY